MKVLIIEDEIPAAKRLIKLIEHYLPEAELIGPLESVEEAQLHLQEHGEPDLYFMDIQLADGLSFELFELFPIKKPVIFTTAFDEYAIRAFKVNSIDYLLKPIEENMLEVAIQKFNSREHTDSPNILQLIDQLRPKQYKQRFLLKKGERLIPVAANQIAFFQASGKMVVLQTFEKDTFIVDQTLDSLEADLDPNNFFRANRSFLISMGAVKEVSHSFNGKLKLKIDPKPSDGDLNISRDKASEFKAWLNQ